MYSAISANKRKSLFLIAIFVGFVAAVAYLVGYIKGGVRFAPYATIAALAYAVISYVSSSRLAMAMSGAHEVTKKEEPRLYRIVENLSITEGLPMPRVFVIEDSAPNACATGTNPKSAIVCATRGLLDIMEDSELEGVMAHELGHVKNYDIRVSMVAFALVAVIGLISDMLMWGMYMGGSDDDEDSPLGAAGALISILVIFVAPLIAMLIQLSISRRREYLADATGAMTTRYPEGLANALEKIAQHGSVLKRQSASTAHLFLSNPLKRKSMAAMFSTHPPLEDRIAKLRSMGKSL